MPFTVPMRSSACLMPDALASSSRLALDCLFRRSLGGLHHGRDDSVGLAGGASNGAGERTRRSSW